MDLLKVLTIDVSYVFSGDRVAFIDALQRADVATCKNIDEETIRLSSDFSLGTLSFTGTGGIGIWVDAHISSMEPGRLKLHITTGVRPEHYFFAIFFLLFFIGFTFSTEPAWVLLLIFGIWIVFHAWFHFIYRLQENYLIGNVVKALRLVKLREE